MFNLFKKYFAVIFIIFFILIFSIFNKNEFIENYKNKTYINDSKISLNENLTQFQLENIKEIKDVYFYYTPYKSLIDKIVNKIDSADIRVYVEVYMLTEIRIQKALIRAENKGVDVKVVLEKNPYKATNINNKAYNFLNKNGINIVWSNSLLYSLNHSKFLIIDDEIILSTGNLTYSTFAYNRDMFLFIKDSVILDKFLEIFSGDFNQKHNLVYFDNLVISPDYSRYKFEILFDEANKSIDLYFPYFEDDKLFEKLIQKSLLGIKIRIIVSENFYNSNKQKIQIFKNNNIEIIALKNIKMHSKAILIDNKYLFIGSVNFSTYSFDKNKEIGIILNNRDIISKFIKLFEKDFAK